MPRVFEHDDEWLGLFCQRWQVTELAVFGSALRDDFRPDSDLDLLVTFAPEAPWNAWEVMNMQFELEERCGRPVDLVERAAIVNPYFRAAALRSAEVLYAA